MIISHITFRDCRCTFFPTTFLEIAVYAAFIYPRYGYPWCTRSSTQALLYLVPAKYLFLPSSRAHSSEITSIICLLGNPVLKTMIKTCKPRSRGNSPGDEVVNMPFQVLLTLINIYTFAFTKQCLSSLHA